MFDNKVVISRDGLLPPLYSLVYLLIGFVQERLRVVGDIAICIAVSNRHIELGARAIKGARAVKIVVDVGSGDIPICIRVSVLLVELGVGSIEVVGKHGRSSLEGRGRRAALARA